MVKRYEMKRDHMANCFCEIDEGERGEYVRSDDYADAIELLHRTEDEKLALRARFAEADKTIRTLEADYRSLAQENAERRERLAEAVAAAKTWENEAERRSRRYEQAAVKLAEAERLLSIAVDSCRGPIETEIHAFLRTTDRESDSRVD